MTFASILFLVLFLPIFLLTYYFVPKKFRYVVLLIFSVVFYIYGSINNFFILLFISLINYLVLLLNKKDNKYLYIILIILNIFSLAFFKYSKDLLMPLGISFFTFNNLAYIIDVKRKKTVKEKNIIHYLASVFLFSHITMGPLVKYNDVNKEIYDNKPSFDQISLGFKKFLNGLIKKVLLANNLGVLYTTICMFDSSFLSNISRLIIYAIYLYIDFSSYTDMALGLGNMMGINYINNFDYPYLATSITDFWRKWHISLTNFFKEYIYIPLGGNRCSKLRQIFNIMVVWLLTALWHGSTFNYLLWGLYYGIILVIEKFFLSKYLDKIPGFFKHLYVLLLVLFGYIFFTIDSIDSMNLFFKGFKIFVVDKTLLFYLRENIVLIVVGIITCFKVPNFLKKFDNKAINFLEFIIYYLLFVLMMSYLLGQSYVPFVYGAF